MARKDNVEIFEDTSRLCKENVVLKRSIEDSLKSQQLILEKDVLEVGREPAYTEKAEIIVSKKRTFEAASAYKGQKVMVHNFASATNPGGGVLHGSSAQEECLCRCSTLYFNLDVAQMWNEFYYPHRKDGNPLHNDDCIYTPGVMVFKSDIASPRLLKEEEWYPVNVITCAAPNLRPNPANLMNPGDGNKAVKIKDKDLLALHEKRLRRILDIAKANGNEVVILGAFGCGAFSNPAQVVALAMRNVIREYLCDFKTIEFAVYCPPHDDSNYKTFERVMKTI